jgi:hypothetical protein
MSMSMASVPATSFFTAVFSLLLANVMGFLGSKEMLSYRINAFSMVEKLEANERRYREFADTLPETVYEADSEARPTFINRKGVRDPRIHRGRAEGDDRSADRCPRRPAEDHRTLPEPDTGRR